MKAAKFDYVQANSVEEALQELGSHSNARLMAGSQSLGPMLNLRLVRPEKIVDISAIKALQYVEAENGVLKVGAGVRHADVEDGVYELLRGHMMQAVAARIAYRGVRNRGTIGGSLAHADPAADWVLTMMALDAQLELTAAGGATRRVPMSEFMIAAYTTELAANEMLTAVIVPKVSDSVSFGYYKFAKKVGEFADASCACYFDAQTGVARVVLGALDGAPQLLPELSVEVAAKGEAILEGTAIDEAVRAAMDGYSAFKRKQSVAAARRSIAQALGKGV
ncbi:MAG TPA: FAD binding domain-containing protein [Paenalcaligenes sp.]|nr:FAD binding domain-containing protein [Paenalcaligenes sp.]